jgi:Tfp pilus assembly protein PilN
LDPININLASFEYVDKRQTAVMFVIIGIVLLMVSAYNVRLYSKSRNDKSNYEKKILQLNKKIQNGRQAQFEKVDIGEEEKQALKNNADFANRLIASDIFPWTQFLDMLERKIPSDLVLNKIAPNDNYSKLTISGYAGATRKVTFLLKRLKDWDVIQQSTLLKLQVEQDGSKGDVRGVVPKIEFEIESNLRPDKLFFETGLGRVGEIFAQK